MHGTLKARAVHSAPAGPSFAREELTPVLFEQFLPLLKAHYKEIAHYQDIELVPDQRAYEAMAAAGALRVFTIRHGGTLLGYSVFVVRHNIHYGKSLQANQDILYLTPVARGRLVGYRFIKWCDDELRKEGVQVVVHHVKARPGLDFGPMLERMGYELVDRLFCRRLDRENT